MSRQGRIKNIWARISLTKSKLRIRIWAVAKKDMPLDSKFKKRLLKKTREIITVGAFRNLEVIIHFRHASS